MIEQNVSEYSELDLDEKEIKSTENATFLSFIKWFAKLSVFSQIGLTLSVVFGIALSLAMIVWSQTESYDFLFSNVSEQQNSVEIIDNLNQLGIDYKVEAESGRIKVPDSDVADLKIKLAAQGGAKKQFSGYELLDKELGVDPPKVIEEIRFQRVLEGEVEKTISSIESVKSTRVLLALSDTPAFGKNTSNSSASVIVNLYPELTLDKGQIEAVINLVSSSVPMLDSSRITVVDQKGNMLSSKDSSAALYLANKQFEFKKNLEEYLIQRVNKILLPIIEPDAMNTQVSASVDFKISEKKEETHAPNEIEPSISLASKSGKYETDISMSHTRLDRGVLRRLSVAVVIDNKKVIQDDGLVATRPYTENELDQLKKLVEQAVGFNGKRGDQVIVSNVVFRVQDSLITLSVKPFWQQSWVVDVVKKSTALLVVSLLILSVFRFIVNKGGAEKIESKAQSNSQKDNGIESGLFDASDKVNLLTVPISEEILLLDSPQTYAKRLEYIQKMIDEDSHLVSQVVSEWLRADG